MQEDMVPTSTNKKRCPEFLNCNKWDAAAVHVIALWFSNAVADVLVLGLAHAECIIWPCWDITAHLHGLRPVLEV